MGCFKGRLLDARAQVPRDPVRIVGHQVGTTNEVRVERRRLTMHQDFLDPELPKLLGERRPDKGSYRVVKDRPFEVLADRGLGGSLLGVVTRLIAGDRGGVRDHVARGVGSMLLVELDVIDQPPRDQLDVAAMSGQPAIA